MKYLVLIVVFGLIPQSIDKAEVIKEYYYGRSGYWSHTLKLYDNSGYSYTKWIHTRYNLLDSGNFVLTEKAITLTSLKTEVHQGGLTRKQEREFEKKHRDYRHFNTESFRVDSSKIYLSDLTELKDLGDSIKFEMGILYQVTKKKN